MRAVLAHSDNSTRGPLNQLSIAPNALQEAEGTGTTRWPSAKRSAPGPQFLTMPRPAFHGRALKDAEQGKAIYTTLLLYQS